MFPDAPMVLAKLEGKHERAGRVEIEPFHPQQTAHMLLRIGIQRRFNAGVGHAQWLEELFFKKSFEILPRNVLHQNAEGIVAHVRVQTFGARGVHQFGFAHGGHVVVAHFGINQMIAIVQAGEFTIKAAQMVHGIANGADLAVFLNRGHPFDIGVKRFIDVDFALFHQSQNGHSREMFGHGTNGKAGGF